MCYRAASGEKLLGEKGNVAWYGEKSEDGLVGIYRRHKERCEVISGLRCVQVRTETCVSGVVVFTITTWLTWKKTP